MWREREKKGLNYFNIIVLFASGSAFAGGQTNSAQLVVVDKAGCDQDVSEALPLPKRITVGLLWTAICDGKITTITSDKKRQLCDDLSEGKYGDKKVELTLGERMEYHPAKGEFQPVTFGSHSVIYTAPNGRMLKLNAVEFEIDDLLNRRDYSKVVKKAYLPAAELGYTALTVQQAGEGGKFGDDPDMKSIGIGQVSAHTDRGRGINVDAGFYPVAINRGVEKDLPYNVEANAHVSVAPIGVAGYSIHDLGSGVGVGTHVTADAGLEKKIGDHNIDFRLIEFDGHSILGNRAIAGGNVGPNLSIDGLPYHSELVVGYERGRYLGTSRREVEKENTFWWSLSVDLGDTAEGIDKKIKAWKDQHHIPHL